MSTFIVRLVPSEDERFHGRIRHVGSGEEALFSSAKEMLSFMEGMSVLDAIGGGGAGLEEEGG
ncbi:MAG: hypothetical protein JW958_06950 [Candidatus Eisenbacteria bacterium]|nr:hypothetical protein [Candidatus Eisenbacteria bacterium]